MTVIFITQTNDDGSICVSFNLEQDNGQIIAWGWRRGKRLADVYWKTSGIQGNRTEFRSEQFEVINNLL